jgi:hypothetical protein
MKVLVVHNRYREPGGEDRVVDLETTLLARHGHEVLQYTVDNHEIEGLSRVALACRTLWNHRVYRDVRRIVAREGVSVVHVHNTLPLISPAVYYAARAEGIPVVQSLHNYRLVCPNAVCVRDGRPCTSCVGAGLPWPAVRHACYRGSRTASTGVAAVVLFHRALQTWQRRVDAYIAPTRFAREMFVAGGLPADRLFVKPGSARERVDTRCLSAVCPPRKVSARCSTRGALSRRASPWSSSETDRSRRALPRERAGREACAGSGGNRRRRSISS